MLLESGPRANTAGRSDDTAAVTFQAGPHRIELHQPRIDGSLSGQRERLDKGPYAAVLVGAADFTIRREDAGGARLRVIARGREREKEETA